MPARYNAPRVTRIRRDDALALAILTSLLTILFLDVLLGDHALYLRDVAHYYYPAKHVLRDIVLHGELPYWNPFTAGGQPMAANPEHEVFYPLTWLILLPSYDLGFRLLVLLHLYIAGWTMYALLRSMKIGAPASFFAALSFAISGVVLSCIALLPILFVLAWLPLTCLFTRRYLLERRPRDFVFAALSLGLQMLVGEPTTIAQTGFLLGAYALYVGWRSVFRVALTTIAAAAVAAVMLLPMIDHARDSVRADGFDFGTVTNWSMPFARVAEIVYPNVFGHYQLDGEPLWWGGALYPDRKAPFFLSIYPGLLLTTMLIAGFFLRERGAGLVAAIFIVSLLLAMGSNTPLWRALYELGLARSVRYPEKFILMGIFACVVFSARVLDRVLHDDERARKAALLAAAIIAAIAAIGTILALTPLHATFFAALWHPRPQQLARMLALSRSGWIIALLRAALLVVLLRQRKTWLALIALFVLLDLGLLLPEIAPRVPSEYFTEPPLLATQLPPHRNEWRLMHIVEWQTRELDARPFTSGPDLYWIRRNALMPMMPARWGIRTMMEADYDMTALKPTAQFVAAAWRVAQQREDWPAVIGSMSNAWYFGAYGDPQSAFARAHNDRRLVQPVRIIPLGRNPRYYFAERVETIRDADDFVTKIRDYTRATAYIREPSFQPAPGIVRRVHESANTARIEADTAGRAFLVISVTPHKYWRMTVDGREAESLVTNIGYQGVVVPNAGHHVIEMRYRNPLIAAGAAISIAALLALLAITMRAL